MALAGCVTCPFPFPRSPCPWIGTCFPPVEPWGGTHGGAGGPKPSPSLGPSGCWEAQCPAGDIQVTVSEVLALWRWSLHLYNGILEWRTLAKVETWDVAGYRDAPARLHDTHSRPPWDRSKVCLSCMPGSAANSENLYYENGVFRDH